MGKAIVYCQACGKSLREEDFERRRAFKQENNNFCVECRPELAAVVPREPTPPPTPTRRAPLRPPDGEKPGSTSKVPKIQAPETPPRRNPLLWISVAVVAALVVLAVIVLSTRGDIRESPTPHVVPPTPPPPPPGPKVPELSPFERDLQALRRLLGEPIKNWNVREIDALLRSVGENAGARREDIDKFRKDYERGLKLLSLREGLVGRWPLDEADGAIAHDASGMGHDGKIVGSPGRVPGRLGGAFQFRGGEDYVEIPAVATELDIRDAATYTLAAWFMPDDLPPGKTVSANDSWYAILERQGLHCGLSMTREGRVEMGHWLTDRKQVAHNSNDRISPKAWNHVAGIVDARTGRTKVFINGKASGESRWTPKGSATVLETPWRIGIGLPNAKEWGWSARGLIDEVLFYARALAPEEIALLAEGAIPPDGDPRKTEPSDAGLALFLRADRDVKLEGGHVASWSDPARGMEAVSYVRDERPDPGSAGGQPSLKFDGKDDYLAIVHHPELAFQEADSFSLAIRVHFAALPSPARWRCLAEKSQEAGSYYGIWVDYHNRWVFGSTQNLHGSGMKTGFTSLVAVQEGGKERRLYVDGRRVATGPAMNGSGTGAFRLCGTNARLEYMPAEILEVRVWRRALDPTEIRGLNR
ncbi:MAG TPA: LamG domain-containing protein [Planctomycetota bacterium]|jgi:hypothetical protein|nr:LamG domain-containing protein [Planctomycetota bacterium]